MKRVIGFQAFLLAFFMLISSISCERLISEDNSIVDSLEPVQEVIPIEEGEDVTIVMNKDDNAPFSIELSNISENEIIGNGIKKGWCIDWTKPIRSSNSTYNGIKLYSTFRVEKWKPINYLLNIIDELMEADSELSWREIQLAIWSLRGNPQFSLDEIAVDDLPSEMLINGEPNFSYEKVRVILEKVEGKYRIFNYTKGTKFAVVLETPLDTQTVIVVAE